MMIDTPDGIQAFVLLQVYHKLKLEVEHPGGPKWRVSPAKQARQIMKIDVSHGYLGKKNTLERYETFLKERGVLS